MKDNNTRNNSDALSILATAAVPFPPAVQDSDGSGASNHPTTTAIATTTTTTDQSSSPLSSVVLGNNNTTPSSSLASQIGRIIRLQQELHVARSELFNRSFATPITAAKTPVIIQPSLAVYMTLGDDNNLPQQEDVKNQHDSKVAAVVVTADDGPLDSRMLLAATTTAPAPGVASTTTSLIANTTVRHSFLVAQQQGNDISNDTVDDDDEIIPIKQERIPFCKSMNGRQQEEWILQFSMDDVEVTYVATEQVDVGKGNPTILKSIGGVTPDFILPRVLIKFIQKFKMKDYSQLKLKFEICDRIATYKTNVDNMLLQLQPNIQQHFTNSSQLLQQQQDTGSQLQQQETSTRAEPQDNTSTIRAQRQETSIASRARRTLKRRRRRSTKASALDVFEMHANRMTKAANNKRTKVQREQAATFSSFAQVKHIMEKWVIASHNLSTAWAELRRLKGVVVGLHDLDDEVVEVKLDIGIWKALKERYRLELMEKEGSTL